MCDQEHGETVVALEGVGVDLGRVPVLRGVDLVVRGGEAVGLLGGNGSGKSTLLRVLATLLRPVSGRATVLGMDLRATGGAAAVARAAVRPGVCLVGHDPALYPQLGLLENLRLVARLTGCSDQEAVRALAQVGLAGAAGRRLDRCSHGMQRRADLARALLTAPRLLLLDEAQAGLDVGSARIVDALVRRTCARGGACVLVSHERDRLAATVDRFVELRDGRLQQHPRPHRVVAT